MGRKRNIVLIVWLCSLLGMTVDSFAQNTGSLPYLNSEHAYRVAIGEFLNIQRVWYITDKSTDTIQLTDALDYVYIITEATIDGGNEDISILFDSDEGFTIGPWFIQYYEYDETHSCIAAREFPITISDNTFYLELGVDDAACNDQSGEINDYGDIDTESFPTVLTYAVTMNKAPNFNVTSWVFDAKVTFANTLYSLDSLTAAVTTTDGGSVVVTDLGNDSLNMEITTIPASPSLVVVTLTVYVYGPVLSDEIVNVTLSNGQAFTAASGVPTVITEDNILYPPLFPGDRERDVTVRRIPGTLDITRGPLETAWSAINPSQYSTHNYTVVLDNHANNYNNVGSGWHIETSGGVVVDVADYTLTETQAAPNSNAKFIFNMAQGIYNLVYTEVDDNTCSTIRHFAFTLQAPFDVDIFKADNTCPTISGQINTYNVGFDEPTRTATIISDTVRLLTSGYDSNWSFNFAYTSNPVFNNSDVEITGVTVTVPGGSSSYDLPTNTGTVNVVTPVTEVIITVTYDGLYAADHAVTLTLTNITGSFLESDGDTDAETHTINELPQPKALAGVD